MKMIKEIKFSKKLNIEHFNFLKNIQNINDICFLYFHTGKEIDYLTSYQFIKELENKFKINVNFIDISFFFDGIKKINNKNQCIKFKDNDIDKMVENLKNMYITSIKEFLDKT